MTEKILYGLGGAVVSFLAPIETFIVWMLIFVMIDLVSGVWAAKTRHEKLESKKLGATLNKMVWYFTAILMAQALDVKIIPYIDLHLASLTTAIICGFNLYSVLENAYTITGNQVFWALTQFTNKKIKQVTEVDVKATKKRKKSQKSRKNV